MGQVHLFIFFNLYIFFFLLFFCWKMRNLTKKKKKLDIWFWLKFCMMTELTVCLDWQCIYYYHHHHYYVCVWIIIKSKKKFFFFIWKWIVCQVFFFLLLSTFWSVLLFWSDLSFYLFFHCFLFFRMDAAFAQHAVQMQLAVLWTHTHTLHIGFYICNRRSQDNDDSNLWMNKATYTKIWKPFLFCLVLFCLAYPSRYYSGEKSLFFFGLLIILVVGCVWWCIYDKSLCISFFNLIVGIFFCFFFVSKIFLEKACYWLIRCCCCCLYYCPNGWLDLTDTCKKNVHLKCWWIIAKKNQQNRLYILTG